MKRANELETPAPKKRAVRKQADDPRKEFTRLKLNGIDFAIGDVAVVKEWRDERCFGTILKIWSVPEGKGQAFLRLRWYYKPADVFPSVPAFIGRDELFDSDHEQDIYVQAVYDKVRVVSFEEYCNRADTEEEVFFTRARYVSVACRVDPAIEDWPTVCVCRAVRSPDDVYLVCERCAGLFHFKCVGVKEEDLDEGWECAACRKR